jgi:DNA-binding transcriptional MocR family regulator
VSVQISPPSAPSQGGGAIGVRAPFAHVATRQPGQSTARPFAALPHDLIADARLKATDVRLAGIILRYARAKATCWPSVGTLAADLARCERTVQYALKRLADAGWITSRPDPNPTGRVLVLAWREPRCTPPVQRPYSQGLPRPHAVAPESEKGREREGSALAKEQRKAPERPMTHAELLAQYTEIGWLGRPSGDPLRRIAERALERAVGSTSGGAEERSRSRGRPPGSASLTGIVVGSRG